MDHSAIMLVFGGYMAIWLKSIPEKIWKYFFFLISKSVEFDHGIHAILHGCARDFINEQKLIIKPKNFITKFKNKEWVSSKGFGTFWFWFEGTLIMALDNRTEITHGLNSGGNKSYTERIIIRSLFAKQVVIDKIVEKIDKIRKETFFNKISVYNYVNFWESTNKEKRSVDTVFLPDKIMESIDKEVSDFIADEEWYKNLGIPYHIGFLLESEPGNGKSSCIRAIASKYDKSIYKISLTGKDYDDNKLSLMFASISENSIISIEDVDCLFDNREGKESKVTMSGLLNAIDGIDSPHNFILFMTTNHGEKLDPALIRPGRIDRRFFITNAETGQIERYFRNFYKLSEDSYLPQNFSAKVGNRTSSVANLQNHLRQHKHNPLGAIELWENK
jgi:mitochondrial chaperone BCS1